MKNKITKEEYQELHTLKKAINDNVATVHYGKLERFTELLVKTLYGKGEKEVFTEPTNF